MDAGSYDPREGVLTSIVASGWIGLVRDDSLRYALAEWPRALQDATEDEQWTIRGVQNSIEPLEDVRLRNLLLAQIFNEQFVVAERRALDIVMWDILRLIARNIER